MASVTACSSCGTRNRVPTVATGRPRCATCKAALPWLVDAGEADFDAAVGGPGPVLVDLWAPWCGPCHTMAPVLEGLATQRAGRLKVVKVDVDQHPGISARYGVRGIPTLLLFRDGQLVDRSTGALPGPALAQWLDRAAPSST